MGKTGDVEFLDKNIIYEELPSQAAFHRCASRFKGFSGPIGSGKSQALCFEAIRLSYKNKGRLGLIGAPTYPMLRDATQAALFELLDGWDLPYIYNKAENMLTMKETASRIIFRPVDDFERLRGTNLAWFGLDELTYSPEGAWLRLEGRLRDTQANRLCGFAAWTPKGYDWVYQKFIADPVAGYTAIVATPNENKYLLEQVPDFYERLKQSYDDTFYQQEALGRYISMQGGLVYTSFNRGENVKSLHVNPTYPLLWALDFNVDPMSSIVTQIEGRTVFVLDELALRHASTHEACEEFESRFPNHGSGVVVYGDASGNSQHSTGASDYQIVREYFRMNYGARLTYKVPKANPSVRERITLTNAKLRTASGETSLWVDPKCKELIKDFEQVSYKADSNAIDKEKDRRRTHLSDALGYLLWQECRPQPALGEHRERLI
ncbi:MAG: terminase family protein [Bryobacteraceae bacterium]|jgi:phage terminase large subunit